MIGQGRTRLADMAGALGDARAPVVFGLGGVSLEDCRRAFALARALGAYTSVERALLPTLTRNGLQTCGLLVRAGGEPGFSLPDGVETVREDRLTDPSAWRCLCALARGHMLPGAEAYATLYEHMAHSGGAALLLGVPRVSDELCEALHAFRDACKWPRPLGWMQTASGFPPLTAYEAALSETGGAHASHAGGKPKAGAAYALEELVSQRAADAALLIGVCEWGAQAVLQAGIPLYVLGARVPGAACAIETVSSGGCGEGTHLGCDGVPYTVRACASDGQPKLSELLDALIGEVRA